MRHSFESQLEHLNEELIRMGEMVEDAIDSAVTAFINQDKEMAKKAVQLDDEIDSKERQIESICMDILLRQQPVARDLRFVSSILKMITDMERIGDHAEDISEITLLLPKKEYNEDKLKNIIDMAEATMSMVNKSIQAFVEQNLDLAESVCQYDDVVDKLYIQVKEELIELIHQNKENGEQAMDFIMIAKYFERIGDHAVNIGEWVIFSLTGIHKEY